MKYQALTKEIIGAAYEVHNTLGAGFFEVVYQRALLLELNLRGIKAEQEVPIAVFYKNQNIGSYRADILVNDEIVIELKAVVNLKAEHEVQLVNYLQATQKEIGLLINFGTSSVEVKRKYKTYKKQ